MTIAEQLNVTELPFIISDSRGNTLYYEDSDKYCIKREFDSNDNVTYYENSKGVIIDKRPESIPEYTMEELTNIVGKEFKLKK